MVMLRQPLEERHFDTGEIVGKLLSISEVCDLVGLSRSMVYKSMKEPACAFPQPIKIGALSRWLLEDIVEWTRELRDRQRGKTGRLQ